MRDKRNKDTNYIKKSDTILKLLALSSEVQLIDLLKTNIKKRSRQDLVFLSGLFLITFVFCSRFDVLEAIYYLSRSYEVYEVDEIFTALLIMTIIFGLFAYRRWQDVKVLSLFCEELSMLDPLTQLPNQRALERILAQLKQEQSYPCSFILINVKGLEKVTNTLGVALSEQVTIELLYQVSLKLSNEELLINRNTNQYIIFCPTGNDESNNVLIEQIKKIELSSRFTPLKSIKAECVSKTLHKFEDLKSIFEQLDDKLLDTKH